VPKREATAPVAWVMCERWMMLSNAVLGSLKRSALARLALTKAIHVVLIPDWTARRHRTSIMVGSLRRAIRAWLLCDGTADEAQAVRDRLSRFLAVQAMAARRAAE
jgi:hypothetical protein